MKSISYTLDLLTLPTRAPAIGRETSPGHGRENEVESVAPSHSNERGANARRSSRYVGGGHESPVLFPNSQG